MIGEEIPALPRKINHVINRILEIEDLEIIFTGAGSWRLYYSLLLSTGLSCIVLAILVHWNIDRERRAIRLPEGRSGRFTLIRLTRQMMEQIPKDRLPSEPLFPALFVDVEDEAIFEEELHSKLGEPLDYLQALLGAADRPIASLFSFTLTHRYLVQNQDSADPDWQALLEKANDVLRYPGEPMVLN